jgi:hypothetical protein
MALLTIFLDDGAVITDKQRRAAEFEWLVGECFVPLLGGTEEAWTRAHHVVVDRLADPQSASALGAPHVGKPHPTLPQQSDACVGSLPVKEACHALAHRRATVLSSCFLFLMSFPRRRPNNEPFVMYFLHK